MTAIELMLSELKALRRAYVNLLESGRDRIIDLGGTCDAVDVMEANDPHLLSAVKAIAAGEAELKREPDFWVMRCPDDAKEFLNMDEQSVITTSRDETNWEEYEGWDVTAYFAREASK